MTDKKLKQATTLELIEELERRTLEVNDDSCVDWEVYKELVRITRVFEGVNIRFSGRQ